MPRRRPAVSPISLSPRQRDRHQTVLQGIVSVSLMGSLAGTGWLAATLGSVTERSRQAAAKSASPVLVVPTPKAAPKPAPKPAPAPFKKRRIVRYVYAAPASQRTTSRSQYVAPAAPRPVNQPKPAPRPPAPAAQPAPATTTSSGS